MKHTPGPWTVRQTGATSEIHVAGERTYYIATVGVGISDANTKANARLIAAAPRMLAMLRTVCNPNKECKAGYYKVPLKEMMAGRALLCEIEEG